MKHLLSVELRVSVCLVWYDLWFGVYIDVEKEAVYICPLPCFCVKIQLVH